MMTYTDLDVTPADVPTNSHPVSQPAHDEFYQSLNVSPWYNIPWIDEQHCLPSFQFHQDFDDPSRIAETSSNHFLFHLPYNTLQSVLRYPSRHGWTFHLYNGSHFESSSVTMQWTYNWQGCFTKSISSFLFFSKSSLSLYYKQGFASQYHEPKYMLPIE